MLTQPGRAIWMLGMQVALVGMSRNQAHSAVAGSWASGE